MERSISVYQALNEKKLLEQRLESKIEKFTPVGIKVGKRFTSPVNMTEEDFIKEVKAEKQSIEQLFKNLSELKAKIVQSNATTKITFSDGSEMTVASAIEMKNSISQVEDYCNKLTSAWQFCSRQVDVNNNKMEQRLDAQTAEFMKAQNVQKDSKDVLEFSEDFKKLNISQVIDPINAQTVASEQRESVSIFRNEVNNLLTESNVKTMIALSF